MGPIEGLLIDLDGTVYLGRELIPGSDRAIDRLRDGGVPFLFTTNTSRMSRSDISVSLGSMGLRVDPSEIFSAPVAAARWLRDEGVRRIHLLVADSTREDFAGFEITDDQPDAVLVGDLGAEFTFERLNAGFRSLRAGARLVAIHRNRFWLTDQGPTLDAGPFVAALEYASRQQATLVGKPSPAFFDAASSLLGIRRQGLAVVGDDLETDVLGGRAAGLVTIQVRTGKFDQALLDEAPPEQRPDHIVTTLADVP
ncbi:MAG: HAD-IIA family hydrolase, partial [Gemmatimonadetes bacterium]|nr:HAD-IIA family hydrolase [Gemmatimonadota bacterium]